MTIKPYQPNTEEVKFIKRAFLAPQRLRDVKGNLYELYRGKVREGYKGKSVTLVYFLELEE